MKQEGKLRNPTEVDPEVTDHSSGQTDPSGGQKRTGRMSESVSSEHAHGAPVHAQRGWVQKSVLLSF